jgi:PAS domain S-box-containing protein
MSEPTVQELLDGLEVLICGLDDTGVIRVFNRPCERLTGLSREEALGTSWLDLFADGHRSDQIVSSWAQAREAAPGGPYEALCRRGRNLRWHFARFAPTRAPLVTLWAVGIDITHEREALVRARELERVVALGNLMSGLTHELRNPLNGALLQLALAHRNLARCDDQTLEPISAAVVQATSEVRRISSLLDDFMVFIRPQPIQLERTDVRRIVSNAIERGGSKACAFGVSVTLAPGAQALAEIDPSRVETAVYQMIANAIDAASNTADPEVRLGIAVVGNTITIEVVDRGPGLSSLDTAIFEPFFTTKKGGTASGSRSQRVAIDRRSHHARAARRRCFGSAADRRWRRELALAVVETRLSTAEREHERYVTVAPPSPGTRATRCLPMHP